MNNLLIAGILIAVSAAASAGETGVINQAGPYEATMRFYLHPAHGFPGKAETNPQGGLVADAEAKARAPLSREPEKRLPAASHASNAEPDRPKQVATRERR